MKLAEQVAATGSSWDAFEFVLRGLPRVRAGLHGRSQVHMGSSAVVLCWGLIDYARHRFGADAADMLESMGVCSSRDIGKVVYGLIAVGFLKAEESDQPEDFDCVLDVRSALGQPAVAESGE